MIKRVKKIAVNMMVVYGGKVCMVIGFKNRDTAYLKNADPEGPWSLGTAPVDELRESKTIDGIAGSTGINDVIADILQKGLMNKGIVCRVKVTADEIHVYSASVNSGKKKKMKFKVFEEEIEA